MKLVRFGEVEAEKPGLIDANGVMRDLSDHVDDIDGRMLKAGSLAKFASLDPSTLPTVPDDMRIGCPIGRVSKIIGVGLNYTDHAAEIGQPIPGEPILFMKSTTAICGPYDRVVLPKDSVNSDWEVELGVVIGTRASNVSESEALDYVAGYCIVNDISERQWQLGNTGQWVKGKSADTFAPIGPWMVTKDEIPHPNRLDLWLEVDGNRYQNGNTRTMIFDVPMLVSYISRHMTLLGGDVIATGTPSGVGFSQQPPVFLRAGNVMRSGITNLGEQRQNVVMRS